MDITQWFQLLSENVPAHYQITALLTGLSESQLIQNPVNQNGALLAAYVILSVIIKRWSLPLVFFCSCSLFELSLFNKLNEYQLYTLTFIMYSYVVTCKGLTWKSIVSCSIIMLLCVIAAIDAYYYGAKGIYGPTETFIYNHFKYAALCSHIILIGSFINHRKLQIGLRNSVDSIRYMSSNSVNFMVM